MIYIFSGKTINKLFESLTFIIKQLQKMGQELDDLKTKVQSNGDVIQSAITLIQGIKQKLDDAIASNDPAALQALSDQLGSQDQQLADAITANTPAAPEG